MADTVIYRECKKPSVLEALIKADGLVAELYDMEDVEEDLDPDDDDSGGLTLLVHDKAFSEVFDRLIPLIVDNGRVRVIWYWSKAKGCLVVTLEPLL